MAQLSCRLRSKSALACRICLAFICFWNPYLPSLLWNRDLTVVKVIKKAPGDKVIYLIRKGWRRPGTFNHFSI